MDWGIAYQTRRQNAMLIEFYASKQTMLKRRPGEGHQFCVGMCQMYRFLQSGVEIKTNTFHASNTLSLQIIFIPFYPFHNVPLHLIINMFG